MKILLRALSCLVLMARAVFGADAPSWAPWVESTFPFYSSVLDARGQGSEFSTNNLTPRGLIVHFPEDLRLCFDLDLLRVAAIWRGTGVTPVSMSQGSYTAATWGKKAPEGQGTLPKPVGSVWSANGSYPGVYVGAETNQLFIDPRPAMDPREVGRGPLDYARFKAIQLTTAGVTFEYEVDGVAVRDKFTLDRNEDLVKWFGPHLTRRLTIAAHDKPFTFINALPTWSKTFAPETISVPPSTQTVVLDFNQSFYAQPPAAPSGVSPAAPTDTLRWPAAITTTVARTTTNDAYRIETIALPLKNPWHRNVRLADIAFFSAGRAAGLTFDGDVWLIDGLSGDLREVKWRRFASGLHEPLGLAIRNDEIFVFDRNGIWKLRDVDHDGEADRHELFSNAFTQTAETREFASSLKVAPDGSFVIGKPGQTGSTVSRDSGSILRISPDGQTITRLAHGFRQPFLGLNPRTGLITASDQQGHYIPTTPLHVIPGDDRYVGFRPTILPREKAAPNVAEPLLWIPHSISASASGQVWLGDNMGPLSNSLLLLGYYRSEIFSVLWNGGTNAAVVSFTRDLPFPPLSAAVHPKDGSLFVAGFQVWGAAAPQISGLARVTYLGGPSALPREVVPMREGILLRFNVPVAETSARPENLSIERWNYQRSHDYGSPHFKLDGSKGQDAMFASSVYLSHDRQSVFVGLPDMQPVMQMRIGWALKSDAGLALEQNAYLTPRALETFAPERHGFAPLTVDLTPRKSLAAPASTPVTAAEGKRLAELMACAACHSSDGSTLGKVGPTWKGLAGSRVRLTNGETVVADANYLRESIRLPSAKVVKDFDKSDAGMPSYEGVITDSQIEALVLYIQSLAQ